MLGMRSMVMENGPKAVSSQPWRIPRGPRPTAMAKPTMYDGSASGSMVTTRQNPRAGRSVRTVSQARGAAMAMQPSITAAINATVRATTSSVRARNIRSMASEPAPRVRRARYTGAVSSRAAMISAGTQMTAGGRATPSNSQPDGERGMEATSLATGVISCGQTGYARLHV